MLKLRLLALLSVICIICVFISPSAGATDGYVPSDIVISQIYAGASSGDGAATQEFISIYNNSDHDVDISNWCVSDKNIIKFACFEIKGPVIAIYLSSHTYATIGSDSFAIQNAYTPDVEYKTTNNTSGSIVASSDNVTLTDSEGKTINSVCWPVSENCNIASLSGGSVLQRQPDGLVTNRLLDTGVGTDFEKTNTLIISPSGIVEWVADDVCKNINGIQDIVPDGYTIDGVGNCSPPPVDICTNLDDIQLTMPFGYELDTDGNCRPDVCLNVNGLQLILPGGMDFDGLGNCVAHDECPNLTGIQSTLPGGFKKLLDGSCVLDLLPLKITELLPNVIGNDSGNEFIEIYNPNNTDVDLSYYILYVGLNYEHFYIFPIGSHIGAGQYLKFSNNEIRFTLVNSSSRVKITAIDGSLSDETPVYNDPDSGVTWALIDGTWQYTNQPTPGGANLPSIVESVDVILPDSEPKPCESNQFRNPVTNRCNLIVTVSSGVVPCKDGQYRSEETNRCRNIVSDVASLVSCAEGQERNPTTNRCRSITSTSSDGDLKPCEANQERNLETNRCRNKVSNMPQVDYKPEQITESSNNNVLYLSLAGVGTVAVGYGVWEWRTEIIRLTRKIFKRK